MPNNTYKSAAVPFVNTKGERSMKRVKVERYVAGKRPAYAKDEDEDEEYYTTDEECDEEGEDEEYEEKASGEENEASDDDDEEEHKNRIKQKVKSTYDKSADGGQPGSSRWLPSTVAVKTSASDDEDEDDDDDDDPRFRMLKRVESQASSSKMLANQLSTLNSRTNQGMEDKNIVIDEDEEEDEEDVRMRHSLARARSLEEPIGPQLMLDEYADRQLIAKQAEYEQNRPKKVETEDILKDLKLTGIKPKSKKQVDEKKADELKDMLEQARQEATLRAQLLKKIEEDNKKELEKEALDKGDIGARDMNAVKTDDEDEELAYEEWKLREIKRVLRDRAERVLETKAR